MKKVTGAIQGIISYSPQYHEARKDYLCDGCKEMPIKAGNNYMLVRSRNSNTGRFASHRLCQRCMFVVYTKFAHDNFREIEDGDLRWDRLANNFKKAWTDCVVEARLTGDHPTALAKLRKRIGIDGIFDREGADARTEQERQERREKQERKRIRMEKKQKQETKTVKAKIAELAAKVRGIHQRMMVSNARIEHGIAKDEHEERKLLAAALLELDAVIIGLEDLAR